VSSAGSDGKLATEGAGQFHDSGSEFYRHGYRFLGLGLVFAAMRQEYGPEVAGEIRDNVMLVAILLKGVFHPARHIAKQVNLQEAHFPLLETGMGQAVPEGGPDDLRTHVHASAFAEPGDYPVDSLVEAGGFFQSGKIAGLYREFKSWL
jgi:hypothetical protein